MTRTDVHQHVWTRPLVQALERRREFPFVRREHDLTILFLAGERPYVIDASAEDADRRLQALRDEGLERALVCNSSPLGIEALARAEALPLIDAYHEGALALGERFGVWGAIALDCPDPADVDDAIARGCIGISLPAGALAGCGRLAQLDAVLSRIAELGVALLVHPGHGRCAHGLPASAVGTTALDEPLWWPALTGYVAQMQAAWLAFASAGRPAHPQLRVIFAMLGGLAPLHAERLQARGGPELALADPLTFYETSSYGPNARETLESLVGEGQILFGSDRPLVEPANGLAPSEREWDRLAQNTRRALGAAAPLPARSSAAPRRMTRPAAGARREVSLL